MRTVANAIILIALAAIVAVWIYHRFWAVAAHPLALAVTFYAVLVLIPAIVVGLVARLKAASPG